MYLQTLQSTVDVNRSYRTGVDCGRNEFAAGTYAFFTAIIFYKKKKKCTVYVFVYVCKITTNIGDLTEIMLLCQYNNKGTHNILKIIFSKIPGLSGIR